MYLTIEFQEEYKRLDHLCKHYFRSSEGVSEYIRQMESTTVSDRYYVDTWENDYKQLKHVRWLRNQLAHEVGTLDSDLCTSEDLAWVKSFYDRIIHGDDPFTVIRKAKEEQAPPANQQAQARKKASAEPLKAAAKKESLWDRFVANMKGLFS